MDGIELTENNDKLDARQWTVQELRTSALLQVEGRMMHHCVGSYTRRCINGEVSIWSLRRPQG
ncbi:MAG: PcfJ domain-containing protein [Candidatus Latescibacterota bacterium]